MQKKLEVCAIRYIRDIVVQTHAGTVTLSSPADTFGCNPSCLSRIIQNVTGRTLTQILTAYKIQKAAGLLVQTNLNIEDVARAAGYDSVDYFPRQFKRCCGIPPREYRRRQRNSADPSSGPA